MNLSILYRGSLSSCNYGCAYCPFALRRESRSELDADRRALKRFLGWILGRTCDRLSLLFTPWGEALVRPWYREALITLTQSANVEKAVVQTNLSSDLAWVKHCDKTKLALWCSYHPSETSRGAFLEKCLDMDRQGIRFSAGVVGLKENEAEIRGLRAELPNHIYLWINAFKSVPGYYSEEDVRRFMEIDPLFRSNALNHSSAGRRCRAGESVVSVDGDGTVRRCHFIEKPIGNLYGPGIEAALAPRLCTRAQCVCHIGYVHMNDLSLYDTFRGGILERIPAEWPARLQ